MTNDQIAKAFVDGKSKGNANSLFIEDRDGLTVIFSYGYHFPLAVKTSIVVEGKTLFLFNSDKYSRTTSKQQGLVRRAIEATEGLIAYRNTEELKATI